jgi:tetratricopeptide (TPR) repeat protein
MKNSRERELWPWKLIVLLVMVVYLPALRGGFVWDDDDYVTANAALGGLDGLRRIWFEPGATPQYYPLTFSTFWLEQFAWGLRPPGYHLVNILLHAANAVLLWRVLRALAVPGAWLAAAIFALHPVHVESVAWIAERKNVLSGFFYLLSSLAYLRFTGLGDSGTQNPEPRTQNFFYAGSLVLFIFALLSKSVTCTLPLAILLVLWWKRGRIGWRRDMLPLTPFFGAAGIMAATTVWMEHGIVGARGPDWALSFMERCLVAGRAFWFYVFKLAWPDRLAFNYAKWDIDAGSWWQYLFPIGVLAVLIVLWTRRAKIGRGPVAAVLFFALTLFPALGFVDYYPMIYSYVADHFVYLASIGLIALLAAWISGFEILQLKFQAPARIGALTMFLTLALLTWRQCGIYTDLKTLWSDTLAKNPNSWLAHNNYGTLLVEEGKLEEAGYHFERALRLNPSYDNAHYNMGVVFAQTGKPGEAIACYREALRLNPESAQAHHNLGLVFAGQGDLDLGIVEFQRAILIKPDYAKAHNNLGLTLAGKENWEAASAHYAEAIRIDPGFADPYNNLGVLQARLGRLAEAQGNFEAALRARPDSAPVHANLGRTLSQKGDFAGAKAHFEEALRIQPDLEEARTGLVQAEQRLKP